MQFLKILFWCLLAFIAAVFTIGNWTTVPIRLWGGMVADVNLPLLLAVTFLIGFLPTHLYHLAVRWRLRQRLSTSERQLADARALPPVASATPMVYAPAAAPPVAPSPVFADMPAPPASPDERPA